jgi:hypothetical protein
LSEQSQGYSFMTTSVPPTTRVEVPFSPQLGKSSRTVREVTVVAASLGGSVELSEPPTTTIYIKRRKCNGNSTSTVPIQKFYIT